MSIKLIIQKTNKYNVWKIKNYGDLANNLNIQYYFLLNLKNIFFIKKKTDW